MNIVIKNIKINSISNIGSLNIGKTIFCKNQATQTFINEIGKDKLPNSVDFIPFYREPSPSCRHILR